MPDQQPQWEASGLYFSLQEHPVTIPPIDVESQYSRTMLIGDIIMHAWISMTALEQKYMLTCWFEAGKAHALASMAHAPLKSIGEAIKVEQRDDKRLLLIHEIANDPCWKAENCDEAKWKEKYGYKLPKYGTTTVWDHQLNDKSKYGPTDQTS